MLSRVLSRTKLGASLSTRSSVDQIDRPGSQHESTSASAVPHDGLTTSNSKDKQTAITFDVETSSRSMAKAIHSSPRKHSYASVKEDSDVPQSFRSRSLLYDITTSSELQKADLNLTNSDDDDVDTLVLVDDEVEDFAVYSDSDTFSVTSRSLAYLEIMPDEILDTIFSFVTLDPSKDRYVDPKVDLFNLLFVSKPVHAAALRVLYRHVKIPQSKAFFKFQTALLENVHLGPLVQGLDFSHYSNMGFGRARSTMIEKPYLTPTTLKACLDRTTNLKAFLVHEHVDDELDVTVLSTLFNMSSLQALDLCASSSKTFTNAFLAACSTLPAALPNLQRLSLHECTTLRPQVFEELLPRLTRLTHLDVAHTMINDKALMSIPSSARITHLNIERCSQVTGTTVVTFLTTHPAARDSAIYLNLLADASRYRLLSEDDLDQLLPALPATLRSLNLGGARINNKHIGMLRALATHLEELGLKGANLSLSEDICQILSSTSGQKETQPSRPEWDHTLRYIDLTDVKSVNQMSLTYSPTAITAPGNSPLEVIEVGDVILKDLSKRIKNVKNPEWVVRELGRRGWYVRQAQSPDSTTSTLDDGYRPWKMGARWWGMRKIPVFDQETGGMYGYFMFKRA